MVTDEAFWMRLLVDRDVDEDWFGAHPGNLVPHIPKPPKPSPALEQADAHVTDRNIEIVFNERYRRISYLRETPHNPLNIWTGYVEWCEFMKTAEKTE